MRRNLSLWYCFFICNSPGLPASFLFNVLSARTGLWSFDGDEPASRPSTHVWSSLRGIVLQGGRRAVVRGVFQQHSGKHVPFARQWPPSCLCHHVPSLDDGHVVDCTTAQSSMGSWSSRETLSLRASLPAREPGRKACGVRLHPTEGSSPTFFREGPSTP